MHCCSIDRLRNSRQIRHGHRLGFGILLLLGSAVVVGPAAAAELLTADQQAELGAATWIPEDAGCLAASYRCRERWQAFTETRAYQELMTMPAVQMGLGWLGQHPTWVQLVMMRAQNPLLNDGLNVLQDAFSQEAFVYVDARGPRFVRSISQLYNALMLRGFLEGFNERSDALPRTSPGESQARILRDVVAAEQDLRMPGIVFGFRLSDPQAGRDWLASVTPLLQQMIPLPIQEASLGGGEYLTLSLSAAMFLTPESLAELEAELDLADVAPETRQHFLQFVKSQTLSISVGMREDYLLISVGADSTHLDNLGKGDTLAASDALAPVRQHVQSRRMGQSRLIGLSYVHPEFTSYGKIDVAAQIAKLQEILQSIPTTMPAGLADRITLDVTQLLSELNESLPVARPNVAASFWNEGIESFSFTALVPGSLESSAPLSILSHAGPSPLMALAAHSPPRQPHYLRFVFWLQTLYGYFEDYAVPTIPEENRAEVEQFQSLALPALRKLHETTRDYLLPSLAGGESLLVLDAAGRLTKSPNTQQPLAKPIRFPRPALVVELHDAEMFVAAWRQYRETLNGLLRGVAKLKPDVTEVRLPPPQQREVGSATLYTYAMPQAYDPAPYLDDDFEPHAMLTADYWVLSLSPQQSARLLAENRLATSASFDLHQPAGRAAWFDCLVCKDLICDDAEACLALVEEAGKIDAQTSLLIKIHVDKLRKVLGAVINYRSRTYEADGMRVKHSWLQLRDLEP